MVDCRSVVKQQQTLTIKCKDNWLQIPCRYVSIRLTDNEILFSIRNWNTHQFRIYISKRYFQIKTNTLGSSLAHIKYIDCNGGGALSLWSNILQPQPSYLDSHESSPSSRIFLPSFLASLHMRAISRAKIKVGMENFILSQVHWNIHWMGTLWEKTYIGMSWRTYVRT